MIRTPAMPRAPLLAAIALAGCNQTEVLRSDGWLYTGTIAAADSETVTLRGERGVVVIPRGEVVHHALPGSTRMIVGGSAAVLGLLSFGEAIDASNPTGSYVSGAVWLGVGLGLGLWGLLDWRSARATWQGEADDVTWTGDRLVVRF